MAVVGNKKLNKMRERYDLNKYDFDTVENTPAPTNNRSLLEGIALLLDYNSNPDNPPIMTGGMGNAIADFIVNAVLGSRKKDLPSRATLPKKNEIKASRQPGGMIVSDSLQDARTYAKLGAGPDPDPNYGQFYDVNINPEGIVDVRNLPKSALDTLRMIKGNKKLDYRATADQRTARDILNFLEFPTTLNFPDLYSRTMADALKREGIGGLLFNLEGGTGLIPSPTRGIFSYQKPAYLTPILDRSQSLKRQEEAAAELLKPELTPDEILKITRDSRKRLEAERTPKYEYDKTIKLEEALNPEPMSLNKYKELQKFKDKHDPKK